jgi:hypothetical protein
MWTVDQWNMRVTHWRNAADTGKRKHIEKELRHFRAVYPKSHADCPGSVSDDTPHLEALII